MAIKTSQFILYKNTYAIMYSEVIKINNSYTLSFSYDPALIADLKANIPSHHLRWNPTHKLWQVSIHKVNKAIEILERYGASISFARDTVGKLVYHNKIITLDYLGACKSYGNDDPVAFGYSDNSWSVVIPQTTLIDFFGATSNVDILRTKNLFNILQVSQSSNDNEVKTAYRSAAKKYHPDVYKESNGTEIFKRIKEAYDALKTQDGRDRYALGLKMEGMLKDESDNKKPDILFRSPLNCGKLRVVGTDLFEDTFLVSTILSWDKLTNKYGQVAVARWDSNKKRVETEWIHPNVKS